MTDKEKFDFVKECVNQRLSCLQFWSEEIRITTGCKSTNVENSIKELEDLQNIILGLENDG